MSNSDHDDIDMSSDDEDDSSIMMPTTNGNDDDDMMAMEDHDNTVVVIIQDPLREFHETSFTINKTSSLEKVFASHAASWGIPLKALRFVFGKILLRADHTPAILGLQHDSRITSLIVDGQYERIIIGIRDVLLGLPGEKVLFVMKKTTKMGKLFNTFCVRRGVPEAEVCFVLGDESVENIASKKDCIDPNQTPETLALTQPFGYITCSRSPGSDGSVDDDSMKTDTKENDDEDDDDDDDELIAMVEHMGRISCTESPGW